MRKLQLLCALAATAFFTTAMTIPGTETQTNDYHATAGYFDVYLKNNCGKEVEVSVRADGSTSVSKYKSGDKTKVSVKAGYEVSVDGKLLMKFSDSDSGKEINLCK